jgi:hypothetical protein
VKAEVVVFNQRLWLKKAISSTSGSFVKPDNWANRIANIVTIAVIAEI